MLPLACPVIGRQSCHAQGQCRTTYKKCLVDGVPAMPLRRNSPTQRRDQPVFSNSVDKARQVIKAPLMGIPQNIDPLLRALYSTCGQLGCVGVRVLQGLLRVVKPAAQDLGVAYACEGSHLPAAVAHHLAESILPPSQVLQGSATPLRLQCPGSGSSQKTDLHPLEGTSQSAADGGMVALLIPMGQRTEGCAACDACAHPKACEAACAGCSSCELSAPVGLLYVP